MSAADTVMSTIRGQNAAQHLMHVIREGCAPADALLDAVQQVRDTDDNDLLRGFMREIQKGMERATGAKA